MKYPRDRRREGGFTLIEVLLVLVILVVLASFAVLQFQGVGQKARMQAAKVQIGLFDSAAQTYIGVGNYPSSLEGLLFCPSDVDPRNWAGPYLKADMIPPDPWGQPYQYAYPGQHNTSGPDIWTVGPEGEIGNWR